MNAAGRQADQNVTGLEIIIARKDRIAFDSPNRKARKVKVAFGI